MSRSPAPAGKQRCRPPKQKPARPDKSLQDHRQTSSGGRNRNRSPDDPTEIVDVVDAFSQMKVSSTGVVRAMNVEQIEKLRPATPTVVSHAKSLARLEADAVKLLGRVETSIQQTRAFAKTSKIPVEIEEILEFKSQSLDETARQMQVLLAAEGPDLSNL